MSLVATILWSLMAQDPTTVRSYLLKLSVPISSTESKAGDRIRGAVISPESFLNGYLEGVVQEATTKPTAKLVLRFTTLLYKGKSTSVPAQVVSIVNSKGHKSVDDAERPVKIDSGTLLASGAELWLDEGSELRVEVVRP